MEIKGSYMTVNEAADYLGYKTDSIYRILDKLPGAFKFGNQWVIPEQSVKGYKKGLQGFAIAKARKEAARQAELDRSNAAVKQGKAMYEEKEVTGHDKRR